MKLLLRTILFLMMSLMASSLAWANGTDFTDSLGYFGVPHDNVGIGSSAPGMQLDVTGTIRTVGFTMSGSSPISGYVLTTSDSAGDTTWSSAGGVSGWTVSGSNVYETGNGNVGIGTTLLTSAALTVMNGNVGIGTWAPQAVSLSVIGGNVGIGTNLNNHAMLEITGNGSKALLRINNVGQNDTSPFIIDSNGNVGINTTTAAGGSLIVNGGNVGIGSTWPGQALDVQDTARMIGFQMIPGASTSSILVGNALGIGTWMASNALYSTSTMTANWPDAIICQNGASFRELTIGYSPTAAGIYNYYTVDTQATLTFTAAGAYNTNAGTMAGYDCVTGTWNISTYYANGRAFNFVGGTTGWSTNTGTVYTSSTNSNVGIGSQSPANKLDVTGTIRTVGFTMIGNSPVSGYVLTASDSAGDTTWSSPGGVVDGQYRAQCL